MPIFEHWCLTELCEDFATGIEHYFHHDAGNPPCATCGGPTERAASVFRSPLMGTIVASKYADRSIPGKAAYRDGHFVWERNTPDGKPRRRRIETFEDQKSFCKQEGLTNPSDVNPHTEIRSDGMGVERGSKGQWS